MRSFLPRLGIGLVACVLLGLPQLSAQLGASPVTSPGQTAPLLQSREQILQEVAYRFGQGGEQSLLPSLVPAHVSVHERCLRPLLTRVRDSVAAFSGPELTWLRSQSTHVAQAVDNGLRWAAGGSGVQEATSGLPDYPGVTDTLVGKDCVVHYTLAGVHASPDIPYVKAVQKEVDAALKKMTKAMRRPYYEPDRDGVDKLHVFLVDIDLDPDVEEALGFVLGVSPVPGAPFDKAETVYMVLDTGLRDYASSVNQNWKKVVKATAYHEAMHCVQSAYNSFISSWAVEGQATWAELAYGKVIDSLAAYLANPMSIVNMPELPLWDDSIHKYSLAPLFAYLEFRMGKGANLTFLEESPPVNDGFQLIELVLIQDFVFFDEFYSGYLARLYSKTIKGIKKNKIPDMAVKEQVASYGFKTQDSVLKTGVHVYKLGVPAGLKTDLLYSRVSNAPTEGDDFAPEGVLLHGKGKRLQLFTNFWDVVNGFKGKSGAVLMVTDTDVDFPSLTPTPYQAEVFAPHIDVRNVTNDSPIQQGGLATITFTYDLLGVPDGPTFPVILYRSVKGPGVKFEFNSFFNWEPGVGKQAEITFQPPMSTSGTYKFKFTAKTPPDSFGGGHMKSKASTKVKVNKN